MTIRYVNTDNISGTEDGTSVATGYTSLVDWYTNESATMSADIEVYCSGATADTLASTLTINKFSESDLDTYSLTIQGHPTESDGRYKGAAAWSTSHYRLTASGTFDLLTVQDGSTTTQRGILFQDLQFEHTSTSQTRTAIQSGAGGENIRVHRCRFYGPTRLGAVASVASGTSCFEEVIGCSYFSEGKFSRTFNLETRSDHPSVTREYSHNTIYTSGGQVYTPGIRAFGAGKAGVTINIKNNVAFGQTTDPIDDWYDIEDTTSAINADYAAGPQSGPPTNWDSNYSQLTAAASDTDFVDAVNTDATDVDWTPASGGVPDGGGVSGFGLSEDLAGNSWETTPSLGAWAIPAAGATDLMDFERGTARGLARGIAVGAG